jgi:hypothetical protein
MLEIGLIRDRSPKVPKQGEAVNDRPKTALSAKPLAVPARGCRILRSAARMRGRDRAQRAPDPGKAEFLAGIGQNP